MSRLDDFLDRRLDSYSRAEWLARLVLVNARWSRAQGVRRLVEEHELHPVRNAAAKVRRERWLRSNGVDRGTGVPIFLAGVPRSGTNMIVRCLGTSPAFEVHNEGDRSAFHRRRLRPDGDIEAIVARSRHGFVLFKPLLDAHRLPGLLDQLDLPTPGRGIWIVRDVDGRVRSAVTKFKDAALRAMADIAAGTGDWRWQAQGLSASSHSFLEEIDWATATPSDGAAAFWYVRNQLFFDLGLAERDDVLAISYDTLVQTPDPVMRAVCDFIGADWENNMANEIDVRSLAPAAPVQLAPLIREACDDMTDRFAALTSRVRP